MHPLCMEKLFKLGVKYEYEINAGDPDPLNDIDASDFVQYW